MEWSWDGFGPASQRLPPVIYNPSTIMAAVVTHIPLLQTILHNGHPRGNRRVAVSRRGTIPGAKLSGGPDPGSEEEGKAAALPTGSSDGYPERVGAAATAATHPEPPDKLQVSRHRPLSHHWMPCHSAACYVRNIVYMYIEGQGGGRGVFPALHRLARRWPDRAPEKEIIQACPVSASQAWVAVPILYKYTLCHGARLAFKLAAHVSLGPGDAHTLATGT